ncbi:MAG: response regulator transcription factor [Tissierellales bacterium]|jgi:DNA-binding response OmpR family regulator|nr:response regulator transcription factor [Tissierellales bacterium]
MKHIYIVDDEKNIRDLINMYLNKEGFETSVFEDGTEVLEHFDEDQPDLVVLDIMMPGIDGLDLCKKIRSQSDVPIIFVSAKDEEIDRILGLELGADDYLVKPFSPRELVVRIKNIFKRIDKESSSESDLIEIKDIKIHRTRRTVLTETGEEIKYTNKEYDLFEYLAINKNIPCTREKLIEEIWGYNYIGDTRMIDDLIKRIRKKLKDANSKLSISTVWGYGYRMDD